jgi:hypothetical protein
MNQLYSLLRQFTRLRSWRNCLTIKKKMQLAQTADIEIATVLAAVRVEHFEILKMPRPWRAMWKRGQFKELNGVLCLSTGEPVIPAATRVHVLRYFHSGSGHGHAASRVMVAQLQERVW